MLWMINICMLCYKIFALHHEDNTLFMQSNGRGWESQGCSHLRALQIEEGIPQKSSSSCQRVGEEV